MDSNPVTSMVVICIYMDNLIRPLILMIFSGDELDSYSSSSLPPTKWSALLGII